jgi:DNA-binding NarL/FixJ family response regulator
LIRVGVVAPGMALRVGLREVLNGLPEVTVVAEAAHPDELPRQEMDVLVLTSSTTELAGFEKTIAVLLLSDDPTDAQGLPAGSFSAWGVLPVNASEDELGAALRALAEGLWVGAPALMRGLLARNPARVLDDAADQDGETLTGREIEVLQLTAQGLANKQIAVALGISEHTIKFHLSSLYAKLGATSRTEAVRAGVRRGLVVL